MAIHQSQYEQLFLTTTTFCYYKDREFVSRPLTVSPLSEITERTSKGVETIANLAACSRQMISRCCLTNYRKRKC